MFAFSREGGGGGGGAGIKQAIVLLSNIGRPPVGLDSLTGS